MTKKRRPIKRRYRRQKITDAIGFNISNKDMPNPLPFEGQEMVCVLCGATQTSDPAIESNWRAVQWEGQIYYACVDEFPPDDSSQEAFSEAYQKVFKKVLEIRRS